MQKFRLKTLDEIKNAPDLKIDIIVVNSITKPRQGKINEFIIQRYIERMITELSELNSTKNFTWSRNR